MGHCSAKLNGLSVALFEVAISILWSKFAIVMLLRKWESKGEVLIQAGYGFLALIVLFLVQ